MPRHDGRAVFISGAGASIRPEKIGTNGRSYLALQSARIGVHRSSMIMGFADKQTAAVFTVLQGRRVGAELLRMAQRKLAVALCGRDRRSGCYRQATAWRSSRVTAMAHRACASMPSGGSASYGATATLGRVDREPSLLWVFHPKGLKLPLKSSELVPITLHARIQAYSHLAGVLLMHMKEV